jgi:hypothetical protein
MESVMNRTQTQSLEMARLRAAATAQGQDARIWRWYADHMEDYRLDCRRYQDIWSIRVAGRELARDRSFDAAVRAAYAHSSALAAL